MATKVLDFDEELLLRHFCLEAEKAEVLAWFQARYERPEDFGGRLGLAKRLRELSNEGLKEQKVQEAMMLALGSLHCLDFSKGQSTLHSPEQKDEALKATVPLLSNLSLIFLRRHDAHNAVRAASLGLSLAERLAEVVPLRAKLLYRRGLGHREAKDFAEALKDFVESARLLPEDREVRRSLEECKALAKEQSQRADEQWRGAMQPPQDEVGLKARLRRGCRAKTRQARQMLARHAESLSSLSVILLAPLFACAFGFLLSALRRS